MAKTSLKTTHHTRARALATNLAKDLKEGREVSDQKFDQVYPLKIRNFSEIHWTPIEVATRAIELLKANSRTELLDVGSGCGKFCVVGAIKSRAKFTGIEQRKHLVKAAVKAAAKLNLDRAGFIEGDMTHLDWSKFNAFYLFNPFIENEYRSIRMDKTVKMGHAKFKNYVNTVRKKLEALAPGTKVITYYGFGGRMPKSYVRVVKEKAGTDFLELWVKENSPRVG